MAESTPYPPDLVPPERWAAVVQRLSLSKREEEVVRQVHYDGHISIIAERLGLSKHTVHTHLARIYAKLGVNSTCQIIVRVFVTYLALEKELALVADAQLVGEIETLPPFRDRQ